MKDRWPAIGIGVVACGLITFTCWNLLVPAPVADGHPVRCESRLKQLATSMQIYLSDFDDRFPTANWNIALDVYTKNRTLFTCPQVADEGREWGYALNSELKGAHVSESAIASKPVLFDVDELKPGLFAPMTAGSTTRHVGHGWVSYGDGSVRALQAVAK